MAKKPEPTEGVEEKLFEGFNFLDGPAPKAAKPKKDKAEEVDDNLSEDDIVALEKATKEAEKVAESKKKAKESKEEDVEELEEDSVIEETSVIAEEDKGNEFSAFAKFLADKGILDLTDEDKVESEDDLDKVVGKTIKNGIEGYKQSIPEDGQKFLEFIENGGNPSDFHKYYYGEASFEDFAIEDEDSQKHVIKEALKLEGFTDEEIQDEINDIVDLGKLEKKAGTYLNKLKKVEKEQKAALLDAQKAYASQEEARRLQEWKDFEDGLRNRETLGGFKITQKMKDDLWDYMAKPLNKKTGETQYQRDSKENLDARYMFAYLLKNKWSIKDLERQVETKQVSKLKDKLINYSDTRQKTKNAKTVVEVEDNSNPFAAFKQALS